MSFDKQKALQDAARKLRRQQEILKQTLAQIDFIESKNPLAGNLLAQLRRNRDRQNLAVKATEELIEFYKPDPAQLPLVPEPEEKPKKPR